MTKREERVEITGAAKAHPEYDLVPVWFNWQNKRHEVVEVTAHWRVHTEKRIEGVEIRRHYWEAMTDGGQRVCICRDLLAGRWYLERVCE